MVILLMLRDPIVQIITSTEEIVKYALPSNHVQSVLHYLDSTDGDGVTFIIDGFDELSSKLRSMSLFRKLIEGDILPNARIVVTSRPFASACLHQYVDRRIEILGFDKSSKKKYATDALKYCPRELQALKAHLRQHRNVDAMCYIPLNMAIVVFLCIVGSLPLSATEMFISFILHIVCRHLKRVKQIGDDTLINSMEQLPQPVKNVLHLLQKIAFDGLINDKLVFTMNDLPKICKDNPTCYGLLQSVECYCSEEIGGPTLSWNFLHLGIQEYFSAKYVSTLPQEKIDALLEKSFLYNEYLPYCSNIYFPDLDPNGKSVRLSNMWILYCGITGGQCESLKRYLSAYASSLEDMEYGDNDYVNDYFDYSYGVHVDYEQSSILDIRDSEVVDNTIDPVNTNNNGADNNDDDTNDDQSDSDVDSNIGSFHHSTNTDVYTGDHLDDCDVDSRYVHVNGDGQEISNTQAISRIILEDPGKVLYLFQCFQEAQNDRMCKVLSESFIGNTIKISKLLPHQVVSLGYFLSKSAKKFTKLDIGSCHIKDHGFKLLHHYLCGNKQKIATLNFSNNNLTGASSSLIGDFIIHLQPHTLILSNNKILNLKDISAAAICTTTVKYLDMWENELTAQEAPAMTKMMAFLECLQINYNTLGDQGTMVLSEGIKNSKTLKKLYIVHNNIGTTGAKGIANSLTQNTSLKLLNMDCNAIGRSGAAAFGQALTKNSTLVELSISNNGISEEGAVAIAKSLPYTTSLKALHMNNNAIGQEGAAAIVNNLMNNNSLVVLNLHNNGIGPHATTMIMRVITKNKGLKELGINNNNLDDHETKSNSLKEFRAMEATATANGFIGNASLQVLRVNNAINQDGVVAVANHLMSNDSLRMLHVNNNSLGQDGARPIANSLMHNFFLKVLKMNGNSIGNDGAIAIANCLIQNTSLEMLEINENVIDHEGASSIANSLTQNATLMVLLMDRNTMGPDGAKAIAQTLHQNATLDVLHINGNAIGEDGAKAIATSLSHNTSLRILHMDDNSIGKEGVAEIAANICNNKKLQVLTLDYNNTINEESAITMIRNLRCNSTLTELKLSYTLCSNRNVKREVETINSERIKSKIRKLKVCCIP
ncbi:uncharacterized protein [Dysidea avara]|uniref:uncharacterized protein n=1 Tax=Dysidea avara TaxID=196820 RepID=UPI00332CCE66